MNKVTSVQVQKNNNSRVNVFVNDEFAFSCDAELVYKHNIKIGTEINIELMEDVAKSDDFSKAKSYALNIIERSYKTEKEIKEKLLSKEYSYETIDKVIYFLKEYSFIDDAKYAQMYINDRIKTKGRNKIKYDLSKKGVDEDIIKSKIGEVNSDKEFENALELGSKKYSIIIKREEDERKIKQKLAQFLIGRGYTWDTVNKVIRVLFKNEFDSE